MQGEDWAGEDIILSTMRSAQEADFQKEKEKVGRKESNQQRSEKISRQF